MVEANGKYNVNYNCKNFIVKAPRDVNVAQQFCLIKDAWKKLKQGQLKGEVSLYH
jgi:hypothetical protein